MLRVFGSHFLRAAEQQAAASSKSGKLVLNLLCPHKPILQNVEVDMVIVPGSDGIFGVLAGHVPTISELRPGVVAVHKNNDIEKFFVSSGFAIVNADSTASVCAIEAVKVEDLDKDAVKKGLADYQKQLERASSDLDKAEAQIGVDTFTAMLSAVEEKN